MLLVLHGDVAVTHRPPRREPALQRLVILTLERLPGIGHATSPCKSGGTIAQRFFPVNADARGLAHADWLFRRLPVGARQPDQRVIVHRLDWREILMRDEF